MSLVTRLTYALPHRALSSLAHITLSWGVLLMALYLMESDGQWRSRLEHRMRGALVAGRFELHYQPQVDVQTGQVVGVEALLRWTDAELGEVPPTRFIAVAESTGLILPLGDWVLREACRQNRQWQDAGLPKVPVAVNVSPAQFQSASFVAMVERTLGRHGLARPPAVGQH